MTECNCIGRRPTRHAAWWVHEHGCPIRDAHEPPLSVVVDRHAIALATPGELDIEDDEDYEPGTFYAPI